MIWLFPQGIVHVLEYKESYQHSYTSLAQSSDNARNMIKEETATVPGIFQSMSKG